jgi:hypothetical protein
MFYLPMNQKPIHFLKKTLRILLWCVVSIVAILLLLTILIQVPSIQNYVKDKAISYLHKKIKTKVSLDRIAINFPKEIVLEGFYFEDQKKDTLLSGKRLGLDIDLFKLLNNEVEINAITLENTTVNISRNSAGVFNFDYIAAAFASKDPKAADPNSKPYKISVVKINLDDIKFSFKDDLSKNDVRLKFSNFQTAFKKFDLDKMDFDIPNIDLKGLRLVLNQDLVEKIAEVSVKTVDTLSKRADLNLKLNTISLSKIDILYDNKGTKLASGLSLDQLKLVVNQIDLNSQLLDFDRFQLKNLKGNLLLGLQDKQLKTPNLDTTAIEQAGWRVKLKVADIQNIAFKYDDMQSKATPKGIDYGHLNLDHFNLKAESLYYGNDTISGEIKSFAVNEKSGLKIQAFTTNFFYGPKNAYLNKLYLRTPQTLLQKSIKVAYPSIAAVTKNIDNLSLEANLNQSKVGFKDILLFVPDLQKTNPFKGNPNAVLAINAQLKGKLKDLTIPQFEISGIGTTKVSISGKIIGLPDAQKANYDLDIKNFVSSSKDVISFVPPGTIPANIQLPTRFDVKGKFKGSVTHFKTNLALNSSFGNVKIAALFDQRIKKGETYDAAISFLDFDLGKLIKNDSLGKITLKANVKGKGLEPQTAQAHLDGIVQKAVFNKYTYKNVTLNGEIAKGAFEVKSGIKDPNLNFGLRASGRFDDKYPAVKLKMNLDIADLEKLNLHAGPLKLRGNIDADFTNTNPDFLNGKVFLSNVQVVRDAAPMVLDSIRILAYADKERNNIKIQSQFLKAEVDGKYKLTTLAVAFKKSLSKYMDLQVPKAKGDSDEQQLTFHLAVASDPLLFQLVPDLKALEPIEITGKYSNLVDSLEIKGAIPKIVYAENTISGGKFNIITKDNALEYEISAAPVQSGEFKIPFVGLAGKIQNNVLSYALQVKDKEEKEQYFIKGELEHKNALNTLKFDPDNFVLNYDKWNLNPENCIEFNDKGLYVNRFYLENAGNELRIQSQNSGRNSPLKVDFVNFKIETILNMVKKDELLMQGLINGSAVVENLMTKPIFTSDLKIDNFAFKGEPIGDIGVKVDNKTANLLAANVTLSGQGNEVNLTGNYKIDDSTLDLNVDVNHLNVKSIQGFSMGNLTDGSGYLSGEFKINGNSDAPKVNGALNFNNAAFRVTKLNSLFTIVDEKIKFEEEAIVFDNFSVYDENKNELFVNGKINSKDFRNYDFALIVKADQFRAIHSTEADNDLFYGDLSLDANLNIKGTLDNPVVGGNIKINEDTKFTVVMPQSDPSIADREGIVEFVNEDNVLLKQTAALESSLNQSRLIGMDVSVAISIDKKAELNLVIDKGNGDNLKLLGEADLIGGIDPSGKTTLTGKYEFSEGAYEMSFNMIKRKFDIQKGSYIIWNGEPTMANLNLTAIYKLNTAPIDLLGNQLGTMSPAIKNTYKQKIPFQTLLKMKGELMKPEISFDIILPDGNYDVSSDVVTRSQAKLQNLRQDPAELNKQVFALLLLNRFVGENPFASESGGTSAESIARQSVSKILSDQLNNLAGDLISGIQLEFDLQSTEDYTSGAKQNRTDLNVGLSKKLLDDRLKVTIGSSFGLEGQDRNNEQDTNIAGDVAIDYQLTKDGRYMIRAYRKNQYQVAVEGQVVETGVAFIITMNYNKFRELFHRSAEEKELLRREKIRKEKNEQKEKEEKKQEKLDNKHEQKT